MPKKKRQRCFVITPIAKTSPKHTKSYWTRHFNSFLKPLIEESEDFEAQRSEPLRGDILRQIIADLVNCRVVVADITDENPNVYWELGVRHSFKHGTVIIAEEGIDPRFNISTQGILQYNPKDYANEDFRKNFKAAIQSCLSEPDRTDSHVLEAILGRGTLFEIFRLDEAIRRIEAVLSECNWNQGTLKEVVKRTQENIENPKKRPQFTTRCLRTPAVELLITNRYLDKDQSFYELAQIYAGWLDAINAQIIDWPHNRENVEEWFLGVKDSAEGQFVKFKQKIAIARQELDEKL